MNLKRSLENKIEAAKIVQELLKMEPSLISTEKCKILVEAIRDLDHLIDLMNYLGEEAVKAIDEKRKQLN